MADTVTAPAVRAAKGERKLVMITAYDAPTAAVADRSGVDMILVGDSLANVVLGHDTTLSVTVDDMVHHTAAVTRTAHRALVVADLPWLSYHVSETDTVRNAGRLIREGGAGAVKLEGGRKRVRMVDALVGAEIPVMGHLGLTPQSVHAMGGYKVQGRNEQAARELMQDAKALDAAGVFAIVLEGMPDVLARLITASVTVPTIGIGAGPGCDGQVLVFHDALGFHDGHYPKFVRRYASLFDTAVTALSAYCDDVRGGTFPGPEETYSMPDDAARALLGDGRSAD
jgi:3-methyl-2-oxobutanoate hydroxymethyltransferase